MRLCISIAPFGIGLDHRLVGEPIVLLPNHLVGSVVLIVNGNAIVFDLGYSLIFIITVFFDQKLFTAN